MLGKINNLNDFFIFCRYPRKFLEEITMRGDQFWNDFIALCVIVVIFRIAAFVILRAKINAVK